MLATGLIPDAATTPLLGMFAFFLFIVVVRTQITYWLARTLTERAVTRGEPRSPLLRRFKRWLTEGGVDSGVAALNRWGLLVVPLSFLFTGTKTVVNAAAGVTRMPYGRYTAAMLVGCVTHATIYATVGWAAWTAVVSAAAGSPWALLALVAAVAAVVTGVVLHRRHQLARRSRTELDVAGGPLQAVRELHGRAAEAHDAGLPYGTHVTGEHDIPTEHDVPTEPDASSARSDRTSGPADAQNRTSLPEEPSGHPSGRSTAAP
ncbi:DedA family protein [Sanguibacter massiliensis]|uniref:DedA family protein n=1 Tax=Sanguibacter massiliensis TaxID=1973217 RepID=UPI000C85EC69|nr:VTT domain-containing protein [Sanguibacter massiliensis]